MQRHGHLGTHLAGTLALQNGQNRIGSQLPRGTTSIRVESALATPHNKHPPLLKFPTGLSQAMYPAGDGRPWEVLYGLNHTRRPQPSTSHARHPVDGSGNDAWESSWHGTHCYTSLFIYALDTRRVRLLCNTIPRAGENMGAVITTTVTEKANHEYCHGAKVGSLELHQAQSKAVLKPSAALCLDYVCRLGGAECADLP